jgi:hypothetical protein
MIGFNYAIELKEKEKGAPYMRYAAAYPGVPDYIRMLASSLYRKSDSYSEALDALEEQLTIENLRLNLKLAQSDEQKQDILARIRVMYNQASAKNVDLADRNRIRELRYRLYQSYASDFSYLSPLLHQLIYVGS